MRLQTCQLKGCTRTVPPGMGICGEHADALRAELLLVPQLAEALESARCKQLRFPPSPTARPRREDEAALPFSETAAEVEAELVVGLRRVADDVARALGWARPLDTPDSLGPWLAERVSEMRAADAGVEWVEQLRVVLRRAWRTVDAPPEVRFAGPCNSVVGYCGAHLVVQAGVSSSVVVHCLGCGAEHAAGGLREEFGQAWLDSPDAAGSTLDLEHVVAVLVDHDVRVTCGGALRCREDLWVPAGTAAGTVRCPACRAQVDVESRRTWLLQQVEDMLLPATELARAIDGLGVPVTPSTVRSWVARTRLVAKGQRMVGGRVTPVYRVGDVLDLVNAEAARKAAHGASRLGA